MASNKSSLRARAEYAVAATLLGALRLLPLPAANVAARIAARLLDRALPKLRRTARKNLAFALPHAGEREREQIINKVFQSIARLLVGMARAPDLNAQNISEWIAYEGLEHYEAAKRDGRGLLIATAHLGNWELSAIAHALMTEPMHVMVRPLDNPLIDGLVEGRRRVTGNHLIYKKDAVRAVMRALHRNEAVGILIDQNTTPSEGVFIDFFGKQACAGSAFAKLAHHSGAAVIPGCALWDKSAGKYVLRFYPRVNMTGDAGSDTQRIHRVIEEIIRQHPDQWMWIHRRWKTRPPGESPLY